MCQVHVSSKKTFDELASMMLIQFIFAYCKVVKMSWKGTACPRLSIKRWVNSGKSFASIVGGPYRMKAGQVKMVSASFLLVFSLAWRMASAA
jgi:hypothetical protein